MPEDHGAPTLTAMAFTESRGPDTQFTAVLTAAGSTTLTMDDSLELKELSTNDLETVQPVTLISTAV